MCVASTLRSALMLILGMTPSSEAQLFQVQVEEFVYEEAPFPSAMPPPLPKPLTARWSPRGSAAPRRNTRMWGSG